MRRRRGSYGWRACRSGKDDFEQAAEDAELSEECRKIAGKAAEVIDALENCIIA